MNRIFSGVQPTGNLHLGNYLGAIRNWVQLQRDYECIFCIVDYHALTSTHDSELIRRNSYEMALGLLALGLDPDKAIFFRQSDRPEHAGGYGVHQGRSGSSPASPRSSGFAART